MIELDQEIKKAIVKWRENDYEGVSTVTKRLLDFWFKEDHYLDDQTEFRFWRCQKEAIEALIYVYEICGYDSLYKLSQGFNVKLTFDPTTDLWAKYCFKMATGSGKTFVMALAIVWQYFNNIYGTDNGRRYSKHFLIIAPNLIVLDRLNDAFENPNKTFLKYPFIPDEWKDDFDFQTILQSEDAVPHSKGIIHLTNWQQFIEREENEEEENPVDAVLGKKPIKGEEFKSRRILLEILSRYEDLVVINDEAHHAWTDELVWNEFIFKLNEELKQKYNKNLIMQLDFSATPQYPGDRVVYFPHIIYDYPLGDAIRDGIVKRVRIGEIEHAPEPLSKDFVKRNQIQIDTGIEILNEFKNGFRDIKKKPVLFIMCDNVRNADKVGKYLEDEKGFKGKVLVIHTDKEGNITKKDLPKLRKTAMEIDTNEYEIIVSVMMLKEGWDVKNVCVIVPLRAYTSQILVEQTLGRGLRRMMPDIEELEERLIVIEHPRFRELWEAEIKKGNLDIEITSARRVYQPTNKIIVDKSKLQYDFEIPFVEGGISRVLPDLSKIDISKLPNRLFKFSEIEIPKIMYKERDLLTKKLTRETELSFDYTDKYNVYLAYMTKAILSKMGSTSQFSELLPKVKAYIEKCLFDAEVDIKNPETVKKLNHIPVREKIKEVFVDELNKISRITSQLTVKKYYKLSSTEPLHTSEPVYSAEKTVFNCLPYSKNSVYEKMFMAYLDNQDEVLAYTKVLSRFPIRILYYDKEGYPHYYRPDFIVKTKDRFYMIETKGIGFDDMTTVQLKDESAENWCKSISQLMGIKWQYVKIREDKFEQFKLLKFSEMVDNLS